MEVWIAWLTGADYHSIDCNEGDAHAHSVQEAIFLFHRKSEESNDKR